MKSNLLKKCCLVLVAIILLIWGLWFFLRGNIDKIIHTQLKEVEKANAGLVVGLERITPGIVPSVQISGIGLLVPISGLPFPFYIEQTSLDLKISPLLFLDLETQLDARLYDGSLRATMGRPIFSPEYTANIAADSLEIGKHPWGEHLELNGKIQLVAQATSSDPDSSKFLQSSECTFSLHITDGSYGGGHKIAGLVLMPKVNDIEISANGKLSSGILWLSSIKGSSTLGQVVGRAKIDVSNRSSLQLHQMIVELTLSSQGEGLLGSYLALAGGYPTEESGRIWEISFQKTKVGSAKWQIIRKG